MINQFLSEMDGATGNNDRLLILAATNAPWHVDAAFRRPGRFDRILFVPPPDAPARAGIFRVMLRGKPIEQIDYDAVAAATDGFSGADLKAVADLAIDAALRAGDERRRAQAAFDQGACWPRPGRPSRPPANGLPPRKLRPVFQRGRGL